MYKYFIIFFVSLSVQAISGFIRHNKFQNEINEISSLSGKNFGSVHELKEHVARIIEGLKKNVGQADETLDAALLAKIEIANEILKEVHGPEDTDKLKTFKTALQKILSGVEEIISAVFEALGTQVAAIGEKIVDTIQNVVNDIGDGYR